MILEKDMEKIYWGLDDVPEAKENGDYTRFYASLEQSFLEGIKKGRHDMMLPVFIYEFMQAFLNRMRKIIMRTLILEMELCLDFGELQGETEQEKYRYLAENLLCSQRYLKQICKEYPLMYQDMLLCLTLSVQNICEMLSCFTDDLKGINSRFFQENPCRRIQAVTGSNGALRL